ncbi:hypothetical protein TWF281_006094 [Arthrobotrys megalospora]
MDPAASLASLPVELHIEIQSYLSHTDIERLSQCSRTLRSVTLPQVFHSAKISPESLQFFNDAGILQRLYACVRHITILAPSPNHHQITNLRVLLTSIAPFTRLTSLKLTYNTSAADQTTIFTAIGTKIYSYPFYPSLKTISLTIGESDESLPKTSDITIEDLEFLNLTEQQQVLPDSGSIHENRINTIDIPTLQTAKIKLLQAQSLFSFDESLPYERIYPSNTIFSLCREASTSLTILHLHIPDLTYPNTSITGAEDAYLTHPEYTTYPTVTELHLTIQQLERHLLKDITRRFRNVEILLIKETHPGTEWYQENTRPFGDVARMKRLKTLWLPWIMMKHGRAAKWKLERAVMYWVSHGLVDLEDICFQQRENNGEDEEAKVVASWVLEKNFSGGFQGTSIRG